MRSRRIAMSVILATSLALLSAEPAPAQEAIRVGFLGPLTGVFAQAGKDMAHGLQFAFEQVNYQVAGRKIELFDEDTEGNPSTAVAKRRRSDEDPRPSGRARHSSRARTNLIS